MKSLCMISLITGIAFLGLSGCSKSNNNPQNVLANCSPEIERATINLDESLDRLNRTHSSPNHHGGHGGSHHGRHLSVQAVQDCDVFFQQMDTAGIQSCASPGTHRGQNAVISRDSYVDACNQAAARASQSRNQGPRNRW